MFFHIDNVQFYINGSMLKKIVESEISTEQHFYAKQTFVICGKKIFVKHQW